MIEINIKVMFNTESLENTNRIIKQKSEYSINIYGALDERVLSKK